MRTQVFKKSLIYMKDILTLIIDFIDLRGNKFLQKKEMLLAFFDKKLSYLNLNKKMPLHTEMEKNFRMA